MNSKSVSFSKSSSSKPAVKSKDDQLLKIIRRLVEKIEKDKVSDIQGYGVRGSDNRKIYPTAPRAGIRKQAIFAGSAPPPVGTIGETVAT